MCYGKRKFFTMVHTNTEISLLEKFLKAGRNDTYCYTVSGRVSPTSPRRLNIFVIGYPDLTEPIGKILNELDHFGGAVVFQQNYGANDWMATGQVDLIVGYYLHGGENDWLGKCYDVARQSNVPLCAEFLVGRDCKEGEFNEKFKLFMENEFSKQKRRLAEEPKKDRIRLLTDREIGWKGKELLSQLIMSKHLTGLLNRLEITHPDYLLKGTVRDLVYNFVIIVDGKPQFSGTDDEECGDEIKFILEQLGYLPRPEINRGSVQIDADTPLSDDIIKAVLGSSIEKYAHNTTLSFHGKYVELARGIRPDKPDEKTDVRTYNLENFKKIIDGSYGSDNWFEDFNRNTFIKRENTVENSDITSVKDSVVMKWFPGVYDYRLFKVDRKVLETLIRAEEALRIPHFAYEVLYGSFYGKESKIPLQQIS